MKPFAVPSFSILNIRYALASALLLATIWGCSSGSIPGDDDSNGGSGSSDCDGCPCAGDLNVFQSQGNTSLCSIGGTLTQSARLSPLGDGRRWSIRDSITVESGVLTLEAGVDIEAERGEYIHVHPDGSLLAIGSEAQPIVLSSADSDNDLALDGSDGWVGVLIEANAQSNGSQLEYVIIAEAGQVETIVNTTVNAGLTLIGDHAQTVLQNIQIHDTLSDGLALEGASLTNKARVQNLLITGAGRDGLRLEFFSGLLKEFMVIHRPGVFSSSSGFGGSNGRAAMTIRGQNSQEPLIINGTFVGSDSTTAVGDADELEVGIIFDDDVDATRLANIVLVNFRNGCYAVDDGADLSLIDNALPPTNSFVDGVHCVNENGSAANIIVDLELSAQGLDESLQGDDGGASAGLRYYRGDPSNAVFQGESSASSFSSAWYLASVTDSAGNAFDNGASGTLKRYNDGVVPFDPMLGDPLFDGIGTSSSFFCGVIETSLPAGAIFANPRTGEPADPQPTSGYRCGFIQVTASPEDLFNLNSVGALPSGSSDLFNDWPLHQCGTTVTDADFCP